MNGSRIYLDWNAGAPMAAAVRAHLVEAMGRTGNASSVHAEGRAARAAIETARRQVAALVGAKPAGVTFTSGGTEAAATVLTPEWTLFGRPHRFDRLLVSAVEHPCVARGGRFPADRVERIPVDGAGVVDLGWLERRLGDLAAAGERAIVSVMLANNETGVIQPVADVARIGRAHGALVHSDAVQALGRIPVDAAALGVDAITLSSHKIGGAQGAGAIVRASEGLAFAPLLTGGGQEAWARAGTENVAAISAFGVAAEAVKADLGGSAAVAERRDRIEALVKAAVAEAVIFGAGVPRLANTTAFALPGIPAETAVIAFDLAGVALSSGSACSSGKVGPSAVLTAMGVPAELARSALRVSIGPTTTDEEVARFGDVLAGVIAAMTKRQKTKAA
jgi:cysteine desulfurase